jgi:hypothetical protein
MTLDPVTRYLQSRDCTRDMVRSGLGGLLHRWEAVVASVAKGYDFTLDDYLNDMDLRDILAGALDALGPREALPAEVEKRVTTADRQFLELTTPTDDLWGNPEDGEGAPDPEMQWWYYRRPTRPGPTLADDFKAAGLPGGTR